jgi:hypothetical protein
LHGVARHDDGCRERATASDLAVAAVAINHPKRSRKTLVAHRATRTPACKRNVHNWCHVVPRQNPCVTILRSNTVAALSGVHEQRSGRHHSQARGMKRPTSWASASRRLCLWRANPTLRRLRASRERRDARPCAASSASSSMRARRTPTR